MIVSDFMTVDPVTAAPETSIHDALVTMDLHGVRHLPVVSDGQLVGVVSDRDLLGQAGWSLPAGGDPAAPDETRVEELMQKDAVTVNPSDAVVAAAVELSIRGIGCLPVIQDGKLVGIVSETDLLRLVSGLKDGPEAVNQSIEAIGAPQAVTASPTATVRQLDELMNAKGIRHVPIADGGKVVGIVSDRDMRRAGWHEGREQTFADEIMSKGPITIAMSHTVQEAALIMSDRRVSSLVTESESGAVGIITSTDLLEFALGALH